MNEPTAVPASQLIAKLVVLWIALLVLPFTERTLLGAQSLHVDWWRSHSPRPRSILQQRTGALSGFQRENKKYSLAR